MKIRLNKKESNHKQKRTSKTMEKTYTVELKVGDSIIFNRDDVKNNEIMDILQKKHQKRGAVPNGNTRRC